MGVRVRPMTEADVDDVRRVQNAAFDAGDRALGEPVSPMTPARAERQRRRILHLVIRDAPGCWVAETQDQRDGGAGIVGAVIASRRDDLWGLSLLVVDPQHQSRGVGRQLLDASLSYARPADRGIIASSRDPRAMRRYALAGFDLHGQVRASGQVTRPPERSARVRPGDVAADRALLDRIDLEVRRSRRGSDHDVIGALHSLLVVNDDAGSGYAYVADGAVHTLAATDAAAGTALVETSLAMAAESGHDALVEHIPSAAQWAVQAALRAGLSLAIAGPVFWRGFAPPPAYLPSGPYL